MYYSSGNYEAFATPKKPEGVDNVVRCAGGVMALAITPRDEL